MAAGAPALFEMPSPFPAQPGVVRLLEAPGSAPESLAARLRDNRYDKPFVLDDGRTRMLFFRIDYVQSAMRIADPDALDLAYTRAMTAFLLFHTNVRSLVLVGLGGGSLLKFCHRHLPQSQIVTIEADPAVIALREAFLLPPDDDRLAIVHADGADWFATCALRPDVVLVDAFDADGMAASVATEAFYASVHACLARDGVLVVNLTGETALRHAQVDTIARVFADNLLVIEVEDGFNHVAFAFRDPRFEPRWKWIALQARALRVRYGIDFPSLVADFDRCRKAARRRPAG